MIVSNERGESANSDNANTNSNVKQDNIILGLVFSLSHLALNSFANFGQRLISKEGIEGDEQNFFLGVYNTVPAVIVMIFQRYTGLSNIKYVLYVLTNGPVFYLGLFCLFLLIFLFRILMLNLVHLIFFPFNLLYISS